MNAPTPLTTPTFPSLLLFNFSLLLVTVWSRSFSFSLVLLFIGVLQYLKMTPNPSLPSFFRDLASLLRALSEAIFVWPIFLSHHLWHSLTMASPSGVLTPVGPSTHPGLDKQAPGYLGSVRRAPRRTSRTSRTRRDSTAKVRRDLTPTPATRSRSASTPNYDRDATPTPTLSRSGGDDLQRHLASANFTNVTRTRVASQPLPISPPRVRVKHTRHLSASTDGTFSASEPDSVPGNSSAGSSRSSSFSSENSYSDLFEEPTSARRAHFRPHSFGLSNSDLGSEYENGNSSGDAATICEGSGSGNGEVLKVGETWETRKREREEKRKEWEQRRLADAIERLQVSLLTAEEKEKEEPSPGPILRQPSPLLDPLGMSPASLPIKIRPPIPIPTINAQSAPKPTLRLQSPPSITVIPPPPQVYDSDMDDEEDTMPTPTAENATAPYRLRHPQPSSNSSPVFIDPFASASLSTITLTSHKTSPTDSSSPKPPSPKGSPTRRVLKFLPGRDEKRSVSPRLPALPSMKKLFGGHRGGKVRSHAGRTSDEGISTAGASP